MRLPRFRLRTLMVITAVAALVCAVAPTLWLISPRFGTRAWSAGKGMPLSVTVLDDVTGRPIAGATIQVIPQLRPDLLPSVEGTTGADGRLHFTAVAKAWGKVWTADWEGYRPVEIWKTEDVSMAGVSLQATAPGYDEGRVAVAERPGPVADDHPSSACGVCQGEPGTPLGGVFANRYVRSECPPKRTLAAVYTSHCRAA